MFSRYFFLILYILFVCSFSYGYTRSGLNEYQIIWDRYYSPYVGSSLGITLRNTYGNMWHHSSRENVAYRAGHTLADILITFHTVQLTHEVYGHGFRLREFKAKNRRYHFGFFHGSAESDSKSKSTQHSLTTSLAGIEAADIMARQINMRWLASERIRPLEAWQYIFSSGNQFFYIHLFRNLDFPGHDINKMINNLNQMYGPNTSSIGNYRLRGVLDLLDPFLWFSLNTVWNYTVYAKSSYKYPMLELGPLGYLPGLRLISTPYGPETQLINYLRYTPDKLGAQVTFNYGKTANHKSYGFGLNLSPIAISKDLRLAGKLIFWSQPEIFTNTPKTAKNKSGTMISVKGIFNIHPNFGVITEFGHKTKGYVPGEVIKKSYIFRLGVELTV